MSDVAADLERPGTFCRTANILRVSLAVNEDSRDSLRGG
jgi:hypothetical protein